MGMFDGTSLRRSAFAPPKNAAHAAFTGLFCIRRLYCWTIHFNPNLRFQVVRHRGRSALRDSADGKLYQPAGEVSGGTDEGYAAVSRLYDRQSGSNVLIVSGTNAHSNQGAAEFLLEPEQLGGWLASFPEGWQTKNLEILLQMRVVSATPGRAEVVASRVW